MNRLQKMAWYQLIVMIAVLILTRVNVAVQARMYGMSHARSALSMLGLLGLLGFSRHLFKKKSDRVDLDERDLLIQKKATLAAYTVFWVTWILGSMIIWAVIGPGNPAPVDILPLTVLVGGLITISVQSVAILVQYGCGVKGEKS